MKYGDLISLYIPISSPLSILILLKISFTHTTSNNVIIFASIIMHNLERSGGKGKLIGFTYPSFEGSLFYCLFSIWRTSFGHFWMSLLATVAFNWECHDFFFIPEEYFLLGIKFWVDRVISFNTNNISWLSSGLDEKSVVIRIVLLPNGSQNSFLWVQGSYVILVI